MPKYQITGPDGSTYEVDAPEGATEQDVMGFVQSQVGGQQSQSDSFASRAASMDPMDLSIARSKNDAFGDYLRNQAMQPQQGETEDERFKRLYGSLSQGGDAGRSNAEGMTRSALQGETIGLGDELVAAIGASDPFNPQRGGGWSDRYNQYLDAERARLDAYRAGS